MPNSIKKLLIIIDLDNTLVFSSEYRLEQVELLLKYPPLFIHVRPFAHELVNTCKLMGDIIVFTTAVDDYAQKVCNELEINYTKLFSRRDCQISNGMYVKYMDENWLKSYDKIIIIDDSPEIWDHNTRNNCVFLVPEKYTGNPNDNGLKRIIDNLKKNQ